MNGQEYLNRAVNEGVVLEDGEQLAMNFIAMEARHKKLQWAIRMVLNDLDDNDSPVLSVAAVRAIKSVRRIAAQSEEIGG